MANTVAVTFKHVTAAASLSVITGGSAHVTIKKIAAAGTEVVPADYGHPVPSVTLKHVTVAGAGTVQFPIALKHVTVTGTGGVVVPIALKHVTVVATGLAVAVSGSASVSIKKVATALHGAVISASGAGAPALRKIAASLAGSQIGQVGRVGVTLPKIAVVIHDNSVPIEIGVFLPKVGSAGVGRSGVDNTGTHAAILRGPVRGILNVKTWNGPVSLQYISGIALSDGGGLFQFQGPPNMTVSWTIASGAGALSPLTNYTDAYGRAFAQYLANGYTGTVKVQVAYV